MEYMTMICDVRNSRGVQDREGLQYRIIAMLKEANDIFKDFLEVPFIITIGDEWEGLLKVDADYKKILSFFITKLSGLEFYCGIGIGQIAIHNFELTVNQLDGPSFHAARSAIKVAKELGYSLVLIH